MSVIARSARDAIVAYIRAKDENRPYLTRDAFDDAASLRMVVKTDAITFPPGASGREGITDVLVRGFGQTYENSRTFCLSPPPESERTTFACRWLVGMSAKETRIVRVGCGRYEWIFHRENPHLATSLTITIEVMQLLPPDTLFSVMEWFDQLPYPWCSMPVVSERAPRLEGLDPVLEWLSRENA